MIRTPAGSIELAALSNQFTPSSTGAGLRFFNGAAGVGPLFMQHAGVLTDFFPLGTASPLTSVTTDSAQVTFVNRLGTVLDAGFLAFSHGLNSTVVVGPPHAGAFDLRFFVAKGC
jgi:hypothetical protein